MFLLFAHFLYYALNESLWRTPSPFSFSSDLQFPWVCSYRDRNVRETEETLLDFWYMFDQVMCLLMLVWLARLIVWWVSVSLCAGYSRSVGWDRDGDEWTKVWNWWTGRQGRGNQNSLYCSLCWLQYNYNYGRTDHEAGIARNTNKNDEKKFKITMNAKYH